MELDTGVGMVLGKEPAGCRVEFYEGIIRGVGGCREGVLRTDELSFCGKRYKETLAMQWLGTRFLQSLPVANKQFVLLFENI